MDEALERCLREFCQVDLYLCAGELSQDDSSYLIERQWMQRAVTSRKREFYSGRWLARQALERAGVPAQALDRGPLGQPIWPDGVIGSITHGQHYGVAVVVPAGAIQGIGIDLLEDPTAVERHIAHLIVQPDEESLLVDRFPGLPATAVAFCVKEAVVKAVSAHIGQFMDMRDILLMGSGPRIRARVNGFTTDLDCIVIETELGLLSASFFRLQE
ncbi:4'-phosphopantetheinyl transferase family protein [Marinobacter arenosus]|uniref:4'-phosphopantetheinyl transferase family protein n=1 Tax=Marinobacter arenosus TaxID=2856822 RepID=UPI001C4AF1BA|nr:4'-phosphopantetheinyl transferase superfamily protein [Marinobacter arenosus]MBW0146426.1 4'-phosphopantetheinyl transferase superfamily protein [Marinobacter arenosus]